MVEINKLKFKYLGKVLLPAKIFSFKYREELDLILIKLNSKGLNSSLIFIFFIISQILSFLGYLFLYPMINSLFFTLFLSSSFMKFLIIFLTFTIFSFLLYYVFLFSYFFYKDSIFRKFEHEIEQDLPDFISVVVSNLKAGISIEKAFLKSVRPEQKVLLFEMTLLNEKIMLGKSVQMAIKEFADKFDSPIIKRTFFLIQEGMKGGGGLARPLERISDNLRRIYDLTDEINSSSSGFAIIIKMISLIVGPLLFALAITLLSFISELFTLLTKSGSGMISVGEVPPEFQTYLVFFSYSMIILITTFSTMIVSQIKGEKTYEALKFIPIYILISIMLFALSSNVLLSFFGGVLN